MKKKNLFLTILFSLLLIFSTHTFNANKSASAAVDQIITYTVSTNAGKYDVTSTTDQDNNETVTNVSLGLDTLELALSAIQTDAALNEVKVIVVFDAITLTNDLVVPFEKSTFKGTINLDSYSIILSTSTVAKTLTLDTLTLNATGDQTLVKVTQGTFADGETELKATLTTSNVNFNSTSTADNYAVFFETNKAVLSVSNSLVHQTKYFYNYLFGVSVTISNNLDLTNQASGKISIPVPYTLDGKPLISNYLPGFAGASYLNLVPTENFYTCEPSEVTSNKLIVKCKIKTDIDTNGGTLQSAFTGVEYNSTSDVMLPTNEQITKANNTLQGYLGKVVVNSTTYYFDEDAITSFASTGFDEDVVAEHFFTEIDPAANYSYFTSYKYDTTETDPGFLAVKYFISKGENASFIAQWEPTVYSITFDSNEGSTVSPIYGEFDTPISLPTPTRTGYTFLGWFDGTNPNKYEITTMPNTNLNLIAEWQINTHRLILVLNNGQNNIEIDVNFGSSIAVADIAELNSALYSKTGYEFSNWFTDNALTNEYALETMPDEDVYVYASWSVKTYSVQMNYNNRHNMTVFHIANFTYNADISSLASMAPTVDGYTFLGWFKDQEGEFRYTFDKMPDEDVVVYAYWSFVNYTLTFYYNDSVYATFTNLIIGDVIYGSNSKVSPFPSNPTRDGFRFGGWFVDAEFTQEFDLTREQTMPARNLNIYAKMIEKSNVEVDIAAQTYELTKFQNFKLISNLYDCTIEYFVDGKWTQETPTKTGTYDIRITRPEDANYKAFSATISQGLVITPDPIDISWVYVLGYAIFVVEVVAILFVLVLIKRKRALSSLAVALPIGLIPTGTFVNIIISFVLAIAGFVTLVVLLVKLNRITIYDDTRSDEDKLEEKISRIKDVSTNESVDKNVDDLLRKEGFIDEE